MPIGEVFLYGVWVALAVATLLALMVVMRHHDA